MNSEALSIARTLSRRMRQNDYAGYDPYDALNSPLSGILTLNSRWGRIAMTQFFRRCPINLRPLFLIRPAQNSKGLGLALQALSRLYGIAPDTALETEMVHVFDLLMRMRSTGISGNGWGYPFPWQNRWQCLKRNTPTIVNSSFIGHALLNAGTVLNNSEMLAAAHRIADFLLHDLNRLEDGGSFCFSYTPEDRNFVHNANMLGASLLYRLARDFGRSELRAPALAAMQYSIRRQHRDGAWFYAENQAQHWIDSFHTGFNLCALRQMAQDGLFLEEYRKGVKYYAENFFSVDGTPHYYHNAIYPIDIHAPAEALAFFAFENGYLDLTERILSWMLRNLYDAERNYFYFRRTRSSINRIEYMRWGQAWALYGLAEYLYAVQERE